MYKPSLSLRISATEICIKASWKINLEYSTQRNSKLEKGVEMQMEHHLKVKSQSFLYLKKARLELKLLNLQNHQTRISYLSQKLSLRRIRVSRLRKMIISH